MPWSNQNDSGGGNNQGPWGQGPRGPRRSGGGGTPPDLEEIIRRSQDQLKNRASGRRQQHADLPRGDRARPVPVVAVSGDLYGAA